MRPKKLTLARVAAHDFNRSLRAWKSHLDAKEIIMRLAQERARALAVGVRSAMIAVVGTLWLLTNKAELSLKLSLLEITIPTSYVIFAVSVSLLGAVLHIISYFILNQFVLVASKKLFRLDASWALTSILDGISSWSNTAIQQYRFLSSSGVHTKLAIVTLLFVNLPILLIFVVAYATIFLIGGNVISREGILSFSGLFIGIAWLLLVYSLVQIAVMFVPFTFTKNRNFIRWNFLFPMYRRTGMFPPHVRLWLEDPIPTKKN